jgi:hypothetical protein
MTFRWMTAEKAAVEKVRVLGNDGEVLLLRKLPYLAIIGVRQSLVTHMARAGKTTKKVGD